MSKRNKKKHSGKQAKQSKKLRAEAKSRRQTRVSKEKQSIQQAVTQAIQHHNAAELPQAESLYRKVLEKDPQHPNALRLLGVIALQLGKNNQALELVSKSVAADSNCDVSHSTLGNVLQMMNRLEEAVVSYRKSLALNPDCHALLNSLGNALLDMGQLDEATSFLRRALKLNPNFAEAHHNLGISLWKQGKTEEAIDCYRKAIAIKPGWPKVHSNLGNAYQELGRQEEAIASYERVLAIDPNYAKAHSNLGSSLQELDRLDEATASYEKALALDPKNVHSHSNLGHLYERTNRLDLAETHVQRALEIDPLHHGALLRQAMLLRRGGKPQEATEILERLPFEELSKDIASAARYELGKLYELAHDSQKAYANYCEGNQIHRQLWGKGIRAEKFVEEVDRATDGLTRELVDSWQPDAGAAEVDSPVFLIGFPRSGTTLLDQILDSHPRLQVMEEKPALDITLSKLEHLPGGFPGILTSLSEVNIQTLREVYFKVVNRDMDRRPDTILVDKFPLNTRHVPLIMRLFPNSQIILALRHPCDVVLSNFMQMYKTNTAMANFYALEDAARLYQQIMNLWLQCTDLFSINYHTNRYEDLVADQEGESRRLLEFLDVEWTDAVLDFHTHAKQRGKIDTPSYEQVSQPIYQRAKYRWRRYEK